MATDCQCVNTLQRNIQKRSELRLRVLLVGLLLGFGAPVHPLHADDQITSLDNAANQVAESAEQVRKLLSDPDLDLLQVLQSMKGKNAVAKNWYLSVAQAVADRNPLESEKLLAQFLTRLSEDPDARYWAFSYLTRNQPEVRENILESMLADPCLELRYEAVELQMKRVAEATLDDAKRLAQYQELFSAARLPEQLQAIAKKLEELKAPVDLLQHFGFITSWNVIGPFNNVEGKGFDATYAPESDFAGGKLAGDLKSIQYQGKADEVTWAMITTEADDGAVDLKGAMNSEKGAVAYALGMFNAPQPLDCELRIGSPNAVKVWLNGELVIARQVYHSGNQIDQYTAPVKLESGKNTILVKSCQNEQTEEWAQDWNFQLRFTDSTGLAIQPAP